MDEQLKLKYERLKLKYGDKLKLTKTNIKLSNDRNRFESLCLDLNCENYKCYGKRCKGLCARHSHIKQREEEIKNNDFFKEMSKELNNMKIDKSEYNRLFKLSNEIKKAWYNPISKTKITFEQRKDNDTFLYKCINCLIFKTKNKFNIDKKKKYGICAKCKLCRQNEEKTLYGHMCSLVRYVKKNKKGNDGNINKEFLLKMFWNQKGLCFISQNELSLTSCGEDMQISLERINEKQNYNINNVCLIGLLFQSSSSGNRKYKEQTVSESQWTKQKFNSVKELRNLNNNNFNNFISEINIKKKLKIINLSKSFLNTILSSSKLCTKRRIKKGRIHKYNINKNYILELIKKQKGRCFYSNIPLSFKPMTSWKCSIERLNENKGYIKDNVCLICSEFNIGYHVFNGQKQNF